MGLVAAVICRPYYPAETVNVPELLHTAFRICGSEVGGTKSHAPTPAEPCGPCAPVGPVAPAVPGDGPVAPVLPVGPVGLVPVAPVGPVGPVAPVGVALAA